MSDAHLLAHDVTDPQAPASHVVHQRRVLRNSRLKQQLRDLVAAYTSARFLGSCAPLEELAALAGFLPHELAIVEAKLGKQVIAIVCVPFGGWSRPEFMHRVFSLRAKARAQGHQVVVVSQGIVDRQPRLGNASIIGVAGRRVTVGSTARMAVLAHLVEHGDCPISELAALIQTDHKDPYGAILNLVANDVLKIDLRRCISPSSLVGLPNADDLGE